MAERLGELTEEIRKTAQSKNPDFIRWAFSLAKHRGDVRRAIEESKQFTTAPILSRMIKTAVTAGDVGGGTWGDSLADFQTLAGQFVVTTSKLAVFGRLGLSRVPFNATISASPGVSVDFVAAGGALPAAQGNLTDTTKTARTKLGVLIVVDDELFRLWAPGSQERINQIMTVGYVRGLDSRFLDPDSAPLAGTRPASIINGVSPLGDFTNTAAGALADFQTLIQAHIDAGSDLARCSIVMHPQTALALSVMQSGGTYTFAQMTATGGRILGLPVYTSVGAVRSGSPTEKVVSVIDAEKIAYSDDGQATFDASGIASIAMSDAPSGDALSGTAENVTSMFQTNSIALKLVHTVNWQKLAASAAVWMTSTF